MVPFVTSSSGKPDQVPAGTQASIQSFLRGEKEAFEDIWQRFRPAMEVLLAGRLRRGFAPPMRSRLEAELQDILQDAAVTAYRQLETFEYRGTGSLLAWLNTIALRAVNDRVAYWGAAKRGPLPSDRAPATSTSDHWGGGADARACSGPGIVSNLHRADRRRQLAAVLEELPERFQTIVMWRFFARAEWAEIARELGSPSAEAVKMECLLKVLPAIAAAMARLPKADSA